MGPGLPLLLLGALARGPFGRTDVSLQNSLRRLAMDTGPSADEACPAGLLSRSDRLLPPWVDDEPRLTLKDTNTDRRGDLLSDTDYGPRRPGRWRYVILTRRRTSGGTHRKSIAPPDQTQMSKQ